MGLDPHDINRFLVAQNTNGTYNKALAEIKAGKKVTHWIWYIFPQFIELGTSANNAKYGIKSIAEAVAYLDHPVLGPRLIEISKAVLASKTPTARALMGSPDDVKLQSCMTLFLRASNLTTLAESYVLLEVIMKYFIRQDPRTERLWGAKIVAGEG